MLRPDVVMKQKEIRKIQKGGWSYVEHKQLRKIIKRIDTKDFILSATDKVVELARGISLSGADRIKK